jgi:hypothetical protein
MTATRLHKRCSPYYKDNSRQITDDFFQVMYINNGTCIYGLGMTERKARRNDDY